MNRNTSGNFATRRTNVTPRTSLHDLPRNTTECVNLFQDYDILPQKSLGLPVVLTNGVESNGDKVNDGYCFRRQNCPKDIQSYLSIRPILLYQSKRKLETSVRIFYEICREVPHRGIAEGLGWVSDHEKGVTYSQQSITAHRSNICF